MDGPSTLLALLVFLAAVGLTSPFWPLLVLFSFAAIWSLCATFAELMNDLLSFAWVAVADQVRKPHP